MSTVIICEKPSQANNIRAAIGDKMGRVVPMRGHILELQEPDDVREEWKRRWSTDLLWPGQFYGMKVPKNSRSVFETVRAAISGADRVIVATDADREGQLIADEVIRYLKFRGEVLRAKFNAEDPKTLREAFANLRPNKDFENLYFAGLARQQSDQVSNLTLTRTATVRFGAAGAKRAIGIGRVKTPVMSLVCQREDERINFKPQTYFEIKARTEAEAGVLGLVCRSYPKSLIKNVTEEDEAESEETDAGLADPEQLIGKIMSKDFANGLAAGVLDSRPRLSVTSKRQSTPPPKLFDLTNLQAAASSRFGFSGSRTLELAQALYDTYKVTTYPRSEAQHLPEVEIGNVPVLTEALLSCSSYKRYAGLLEKPEIRKGKTGHFSDRALEGMSHYAIIPNAAVAADMPRIVASLPADEGRLFDMIARRYLSAIAPDYQYQKTDVWFDHPHPGPDGGSNHDWRFSTSGSVPLVQGWREIAGVSGEGTELPAVKNGDSGHVTKTDLLTKTTSPRPRFNDGTILLAMKSPWHFVPKEKAKLRATLKETEGIGRPSTRDSIVDGLIKQDLLKREKKEIAPTKAGMQLWNLLRRVSPELTDVVRTAVWEDLFKKVSMGQMTAESAVDVIIKETVIARDKLVAASGGEAQRIGKAAPPNPKAVMFAQKLAQMKGLELDQKRLKDREYVYGFLDQHSPKEGESLPPSEKQVAFARSLAERIGTEIPAEALRDGKVMKTWLDESVGSAPPAPPSEKALSFARTLSEQSGVPLPQDAERSAKACSEFINANKGASGGKSGAGSHRSGPPSPKSLDFARSIAERAGVRLPKEAETSAAACSQFIDKHKGSGGAGSAAGSKKTFQRKR